MILERISFYWSLLFNHAILGGVLFVVFRPHDSVEWLMEELRKKMYDGVIELFIHNIAIDILCGMFIVVGLSVLTNVIIKINGVVIGLILVKVGFKYGPKVILLIIPHGIFEIGGWFLFCVGAEWFNYNLIWVAVVLVFIAAVIEIKYTPRLRKYLIKERGEK